MAQRVGTRRAGTRQMGARPHALQRAVQEIHAALDVERIAELALDCALEITHAEAGLIRVALPGHPPTMRATGATPDESQIETAMLRAAALDGPTVLPPEPLSSRCCCPRPALCW